MPEPEPDIVEFRLGIETTMSQSLGVTTVQSAILSVKRTESQDQEITQSLSFTMEL